MHIDEAKKMVGEKNWKEFQKWMHGQTVGIYSDGSINYYDHDVNSFIEQKKRNPKKQPTNWD